MEDILKQIRLGLLVVMLLVVVLVGLTATLVAANISDSDVDQKVAKTEVKKAKPIQLPRELVWKAPEMNLITNKDEKILVEYGRDLIVNTAKYLGPEGIVGKLTNGMNCQNCHLDAGTKPFGNNYSAVYSTYPKFRARSGTKETIVKRISDCFERSLNGFTPDGNSKEMKAMVAYIKFLGTDIKKGTIPKGAGLEKLVYLDRAANPKKGALLYQSKCITCHGADGNGIQTEDKKLFKYPPLWGAHSYNDAAGLYRISNFAGYIKNNMPFGATYKSPMLTDDEAWDIAAFVNSQPRPHKDQKSDWKDVSKKPIDFPYGPYNDKFNQNQHKLGPFKPIAQAQKNKIKIT